MPSMPKFTKVEEQKRSYVYPGGDRLDITGVVEVAVSQSGNHRITTNHDDEKYIVSPGWRYIKLNMKDWSF